MRNLLALIGLAVVGFGGAGWYLGWYKLSVSRTPEGNLQINTTVDTKKVENESTEALKNLGSAISGQVEKAAQESKSAAPANTPGPLVPSVTPPAGVKLPEIPAVPGPTPPLPPANPEGPIKLIPPK